MNPISIGYKLTHIIFRVLSVTLNRVMALDLNYWQKNTLSTNQIYHTTEPERQQGDSIHWYLRFFRYEYKLNEFKTKQSRF